MKKNIINYLFILAFFLTGCFNKDLTENKKTLIVKEKINRRTLITLIRKGVYEDVESYLKTDFRKAQKEKERLDFVSKKIATLRLSVTFSDKKEEAKYREKICSLLLEKINTIVFDKEDEDLVEQEPEDDDDVDSKEYDYGDSQSDSESSGDDD